MKIFTSVKARIIFWYTALMLLIICAVLFSVGTLSYRLSMDTLEATVKANAVQISEKIRSRNSKSAFFTLENDEEFKNVTIYRENGEYFKGLYDYSLSQIPFENDKLRKESVDGKTYILYDVFKPGAPGKHEGYWIRSAASTAITGIMGRSVSIILLIAIPFILIITVLGGYFLTAKAFRPVDYIADTANEICSSNDIKKRIPIDESAHEDELKKLSLTLNKMLDKIEALIAAEKQFTSAASHELRTPVSVILAQGEYLADIVTGEKEKELADTVVSRAQHMSRLINSLLLLSRIDKSSQKFSMEKVDLGVITDIAVESLRPMADEKKILIVTNIEDGLIVNANEALLQSAITNLISNAVKYGREEGYVAVSALRLSDTTEITVADNGIGIPDVHIDKIWNRFYRIDSVRNDEYGSCGLGLATVKSIVSLHGGTISVKSIPGEGSEFTIVLKQK